jgi:predicted enzyme involved in methoxymalonyl-ACP biosynthesis
LSCRILSRKIEEYIIYLIQKKNRNKEIYLEHVKTDKNKELIKIFLENNSFQKVSKKMMDKVKFKGELYKVLLNKKLINVEKFF